MDTASPINTIAKPYLDIYRYDHAAYFTFESLGKVKAEPEDLVDIAYWALLGKEYEIGLILCNQLAALPGAVSERFARIFSLLLLMNGNHEQANSILSQLLDLGTNPWCSHFLQNSGKDPLGIMAGAAEFDAELIEASVVNMFQSVHFCVKVNCPNCGNHFTTATK
ncbi:MAG: hypothetical protein KDD42_10150, partial [Bdellovibrionales bacterium]|nr:hypothetical protein [Bdellovibrionales bacterium]